MIYDNMPDYSKCVIYTIKTPTGLYVGSTCNFVNRKYQHKMAIHNENGTNYNIKLYKNIRENNDEWDMKPHCEFPCENKMQMNIEEERVRRELNANLNSVSCYNVYRDSPKEQSKDYYYKNKERICKNLKIPDNENRHKIKIKCECGQEVSSSCMYKHKKGKKHIKLLEEKKQNIKEE